MSQKNSVFQEYDQNLLPMLSKKISSLEGEIYNLQSQNEQLQQQIFAMEKVINQNYETYCKEIEKKNEAIEWLELKLQKFLVKDEEYEQEEYLNFNSHLG